MCGICGFSGASDTDMPILKAMCDVIAHRGPDGEGQLIAGNMALGHRRLSLIDLAGGAQPMCRASAKTNAPTFRINGMEIYDAQDFSARYAIVFNGEIYNYAEIKSELEQMGYTFNTTSDTEVLLVGYIAWGEEVLARLRGMFAFAIYDSLGGESGKGELFCARDPFGIKPFYYCSAGGHFIFASEIKSILEHPAYERELNMEALEQYLMFQFSALPETFFKGVFKLAPAHFMRVDVERATFTIHKYWSPVFDIETGRSVEGASAEIDEVFRESVRYHNVADVEVGSFLSSGIDSSYMAACLADVNPDIKTFTVGFDEYSGERDEISWARELAGELGVKNTAHHIGRAEYWEALPRIQWHMDEPSADPSAVALYFVDKLAATQVKAVLSGEGADEFFGGYKIYQAPLESHKVEWAPKWALKGAASAMRALGVRGANYLERAAVGVAGWYYTNANGVAFSYDEAKALLKGGRVFSSPQEVCAPVYEAARELGLDAPTQMQYLDLHFWLVGDILLKTDKMSMAHSLESRVPFLDRRVFEIAAGLPTEQKVNLSQTKIALRGASGSAIPRDWAEKPKLGFPVPIVRWLRDDDVYNAIKQAFISDLAAEFFDCEMLVSLLERHRAGEDLSRRIWIVYMFLMWYRIYFVDRARPE